MLASRILFWGGVLSLLVMTLGIVGFAARGGLRPAVLAESRIAENRQAARPPDVFVSVAQVRRALARSPVEPLAIVATGILLLLATPVVAVVAVFGVFAGVGDRRYAGITAVLIVALLLSLVFVGGQ